MGRVLAYGEIEARSFPGDEDFATATEVFQDAVADECENGSVVGGFIYGSAAIGAANLRSNIDMLITTVSSSERCMLSAERVVAKMRYATGDRVPLSAMVLDAPALTDGRHDIDRYFGQHLTGHERLVVGKDPADFIAYPPASPYQLLANYTAHKKRRLTELYMMGEAHEVENRIGLQRMLELPMALGRKALQACHESSVTDTDPCYSANKFTLNNSIYALMEEQGLERSFEDMTGLNDRYADVLHDTIWRGRGKALYYRELSDMYYQLPNATEWIDRVETTILPQLSDEVRE